MVHSKGNRMYEIKKYFDGFGRVVLTSSTSEQCSFEEEEISKEGVLSIFTNAIVRELKTGEADIDGDNCISVTDLYHYVDGCVTSERQSPTINTFSQQCEICIARNPKPINPEMKKSLERTKEHVLLMANKQIERQDLITERDPVKLKLSQLKKRLDFITEEEERVSKLDSYDYFEFLPLYNERKEFEDMIQKLESELRVWDGSVSKLDEELRIILKKVSCSF
jgi:hypothetical protein